MASLSAAGKNPCGYPPKKVYWPETHVKQHGFTLIELAVALAVMAILTGIAFGSFGWMDRKILNDTSQQLASDIRYTQRMAMIEGLRWGITIDEKNNAYLVMRQRPIKAETKKTVRLSHGVRFRRVNRPSFEYLPRGTITGGFTIWLSKGKYWQRITAVPSAGRIEVKPVVVSINDTVPLDD
jgi:prepilin-type N-terminal cleavage/methylation domain-containing protein